MKHFDQNKWYYLEDKGTKVLGKYPVQVDEHTYRCEVMCVNGLSGVQCILEEEFHYGSDFEKYAVEIGEEKALLILEQWGLIPER